MKPDEFLHKAYRAAYNAGHIWPSYAAAEAALESAWGESQLAVKANNLFGQKSGPMTEGLPTIELPTHEWNPKTGRMEPSTAKWPMFKKWEDCFHARMDLLRNRKRYAAALAAKSGEEFVRQVSNIWATDPKRGDKVIEIYKRYIPDLERKLEEWSV